MKKDDKQVLLDVKNLKKYFDVGNKKILKAVDDVSLQIYKGETLGLVGESGCGKSVTSLSIMKLLARNSKISNGEILLNGKDLLKEDKKGPQNIRGPPIKKFLQ